MVLEVSETYRDIYGKYRNDLEGSRIFRNNPEESEGGPHLGRASPWGLRRLKGLAAYGKVQF